jgi:hypothetical protein
MSALTFEPSPGTHIKEACKKAAAMAINKSSTVEFEFNGIKVTATPQSSPASLELAWESQMEADRKARKESPEYAAEQQRRAETVKTSQNVVNCFMDGIEHVLATCSTNDILKYVQPFVGAADDVAVTFDKTGLADLLEQYGYKDNMHVGKPQWAFDDKETMAQYILGQVVNCLRRGMSPHPITISFIEKYFKLPT